MNVIVRIKNTSKAGRKFTWLGTMGTWIDKDTTTEVTGDPWSLASETERQNMDGDVRAGNVELEYRIDMPKVKVDKDAAEAAENAKTREAARLTMPTVVESKETARAAKNFGFEEGSIADSLPRPEALEKPAMQTALPAATRLEDMLEGPALAPQAPAQEAAREKKMD